MLEWLEVSELEVFDVLEPVELLEDEMFPEVELSPPEDDVSLPVSPCLLVVDDIFACCLICCFWVQIPTAKTTFCDVVTD